MDHCYKTRSKTSTDTIQQKNKKYSESSYQVQNPVLILQKARLNPRSLNHREIRQLHSTIGNQAIQRLFTQSEPNSTSINSPVRLSHLPGHSVILRQASPSSEAALKAEKLNVLSDKEQKEIEPLLNPNKDVGKNRQMAIDKILKYSGLQSRLPSLLDGGKMWYHPNLADLCKQKETDPEERKGCDSAMGFTHTVKVIPPSIKDPELRRRITLRISVPRVEIGPLAFKSIAVLYSTVYHEYVHAHQITRYDPKLSETAMEVEAYILEISQAGITGIAQNPSVIFTKFNKLDDYYQKLDAQTKPKYKKEFETARRVALLHFLNGINDIEQFTVNKLFIEAQYKDMAAADKKKITQAIDTAAQRIFKKETKRLLQLKLDINKPPEHFYLQQIFEAIGKSRQDALKKEYVEVLLHFFGLCESAIKKLKKRFQKKQANQTMGGTFTSLEISIWRLKMDALLKEITNYDPSKKDSLKKRYNKAATE